MNFIPPILQVILLLLINRSHSAIVGFNELSTLIYFIRSCDHVALDILLTEHMKPFPDEPSSSLYDAAFQQMCPLEVFQVLLKHDIAPSDKVLHKYFDSRSQFIVKVFVEQGLGDAGALLLKALKENYQIAPYTFQFLISLRTSNVNCVDDAGFTPCMYAVQFGNLAVVVTLVKAGASLHSTYENGETLLERAFSLNQFEIVKYLIKVNGPGIDALGQKLDDKLTSETWPVLKLLIEEGHKCVQNEMLSLACRMIRDREAAEDAVSFLIERGVDVNFASSSGGTPLMITPNRFTDSNLALYLIEADTCLDISNDYGDTALDRAIMAGNFRIARILISEQAPGNHVFYHCCYNLSYELVPLLIDRGYNLDELYNGKLIVYRLVNRHLYELAYLLVEAGARVDVEFECSSGRFPNLLALLKWRGLPYWPNDKSYHKLEALLKKKARTNNRLRLQDRNSRAESNCIVN